MIKIALPCNPGSYGLHGKDVLCELDPKTTIIAVDPGHASILSLVRFHPRPPDGRDVEEKERDSVRRNNKGQKARRKDTRDKTFAELGLSAYDLKNTVWRSMNGNMKYTQRTRAQDQRLKMESPIFELSVASSRVPRSSDYLLHTTARLKTAKAFEKVMGLKNRRRWKFDSYRDGQRAVHKLTTAILSGVEDKNNAIVAWGNGSFGPTSRGHASAPNKGLRKSLCRFLPIVLVDEHKTSRKSCCCQADVLSLRTPEYKKRTTVLQCDSCQRLLGRDVCAAVNIGNVFKHQVRTQDATLPSYLKRKEKFGEPIRPS